MRQHQPDLAKAAALGDALTVFTVVPWALCAAVYSLLHWTYPRDKQRGTGEALVQFSPLAVEEEITDLQGADWGQGHQGGDATATGRGMSDRTKQSSPGEEQEVELGRWSSSGMGH